MWLYYWLAANGVNPFKDVKTITVPPPQMVATCASGLKLMDDFLRRRAEGLQLRSQTASAAITTGDIWHPEKVLGCTADF